MIKFLFFNLPAHGHVNPSLPLVSELTRRGHDVTFFSGESFRARVEATGAHFEELPGVRDDYFTRRGQNGSTPWEIARIMQEDAAAMLPDLLMMVDERRPDAILYDCMCPWGYYAARAARLPAIASYSLIPMTPHMMRDWRVLRLSMGAALTGIGSGVKANQAAAAIAKRYTIKPLGMMQLLNVPGDLCVVYSSADFVPNAKTFSSHYKFVGWTLQEPPDDDPFTHESDRPLVYASLGTLINENKAFFQAAIDAATGTDYDLFISTGGRYKAAEFGALPPNITVTEWAPQTQVLRQASLFITHGGVNSIQDGLYCDLPLLLVPQQDEQTINGFAVIDKGAGLMLRRNRVDAASLRAGVQRLLTEPSYKQNARRLGASLRAGGGAVAGADVIEPLIGSAS